MNQNTRILAYLAHHRRQGITQLEATQELGILRLSQRIIELQESGYEITKKRVVVKNGYDQPCHVMRYWLVPSKG